MRTARLLFLVGIVGASIVTAAPLTDLSAPQQRATSVALAKTLLEAPKRAPLAPDYVAKRNPFKPYEEVAVASPTETGGEAPVLSQKDVLTQVCELVRPSGTVTLGGQAILLIGQKKFKVGDTIPVPFEGKTYELEVRAIERASVTLRLDGHDLIRPIQPAKLSTPKP